jgi:hypothetical protein
MQNSRDKGATNICANTKAFYLRLHLDFIAIVTNFIPYVESTIFGFEVNI